MTKASNKEIVEYYAAGNRGFVTCNDPSKLDTLVANVEEHL